MPTITIRVSDDEKAALERAAARDGKTVSEYIRQAIDLRHEQPDLAETVRVLVGRSNEHIVHLGDLESRMRALEEIARRSY